MTVVENQINKMTLDEKIEQLHGSAFYDCVDNKRLGIEGFHVCDGPHGVRNESGGGIATAFPVGIAMTATWDPEFMERIGWAMGREFRGYGRNTVLGPSVDIQRDPRNGRSPECGGEDPFLAGKINAALVRGIQSTHAIGTVKHFAATNHQANRANNNHTIDERSLREFFGLPFRIVVHESDVWSVMCAYNWINGIPSSENFDLLTQMLKNEWGFEYFVMSDWWSTYTNAANPICAGLDLEMPEGLKFPHGLKAAVESGEVSMDILNQALTRVLRAKSKAGFFDPATPRGDKKHVNCPEHQQINLEAGKKSIVLLKNEDSILPLSKDTSSIALIGPNANRLVLDGFGSSKVDPFYVVTPLEGIKNSAPGVNIIYEEGCEVNSENRSGFEAAKKAASQAERVIFVGGLDDSQEGEGYDSRAGKDRENASVQLPGRQQELINELASVNPDIIVVIQSGGICSVSECLKNIKGLVYGWYCGNEGGNAIAQVLFGDYNPGGKLPVTMPASDGQLPGWEDLDFSRDMIDGVGYRRFDALKMQPLFAFGHGLSYTKFEYSNLKISLSGAGSENVTVSCDVKNCGERRGDEVVQLYLSHNDAPVEMPEKQLKGFERLSLAPGETKTASMTLTPYELSYWCVEKKHYVVKSGGYTVRVGGSSDKLELSDSFKITGDYLIPYKKDTPWINILAPTGRSEIKNMFSILWDTYNPAGAELSYKIELWTGAEWIVLAEGLKEQNYDWDTSGVTDGVYKIRLSSRNGAGRLSVVSGAFSIRNNALNKINVALKKPVTVSSSENEFVLGENAVDGKPETRWGSGFSQPQWICVDLEKLYDLTSISIKWEFAYAARYEIHVSTDGEKWTTVSEVTKDSNSPDEVVVQAQNVRFVRVLSTWRATDYGFSIYNLEVFGTESIIKYRLKTSVSGSGSVQTVGALYEAGTEASLVALPAEGWKFVNWSGDLTGTGTNSSIVMDSDKNITAVFEKEG